MTFLNRKKMSEEGGIFMFKQSMEIKKCSKCGRKLGDCVITIRYENKYICNICYKMESRNEHREAHNCDEEIKLEEDVETFIRNISDGKYFREGFAFPKMEKKYVTPKEIVEYLDKNVKGQEEAKKILAVAICNHYRRINAISEEDKIPKSNVLIQGPTGSGKTYILKMLADLLEVPFYIADASLITEASYKGNDVESVITGLYQAAGGDIEKTQKGIIYLDEFDKLSSNYGATSERSSVGAGVQRQMLKMIEGCVMDIPKTGHRKAGECVTVNTENILFVCGGAFVGIEKLKEEEKTVHTIGFCTEQQEKTNVKARNERLCPEDFIKFGMIPEIVGRLPLIASLKELTKSDMENILKNTENSLIKKYCKLFDDNFDVELVFEEDAIAEIANQAYAKKIGARGLNAIVENVMQELLYEVPSEPSVSRCIITKKVVQGLEKTHMVTKNRDS